MNPATRDEAVNRLREESARRVEQRGRVRAFSSWCALATLAGGMSLVALGAGDARQARVEVVARVQITAVHAPAAAEAAARERDHREECAELAAASRTLGSMLGARLAGAHGKKQRDGIWAEMQQRHAPIARAQADRSCPVSPLEPEEPRPQRRTERKSLSCGCGGCGHGF
jgi:hypothetical protein